MIRRVVLQEAERVLEEAAVVVAVVRGGLVGGVAALLLARIVGVIFDPGPARVGRTRTRVLLSRRHQARRKGLEALGFLPSLRPLFFRLRSFLRTDNHCVMCLQVKF